MPDTTILSVSYRSTAYLRELLPNLVRKAAEPERLSVLLIDNTNGADPALAELESPVPLRVVPCHAADKNGSRNHAKGLDLALSLLDTRYTVLVDPDIHVFRHGWDRLCREELERRSAIAIGAPYPEWKVGKYHRFPSPPFTFFLTEEFRALGVGYTPFGPTRAADAWVFCLRQIGRLGDRLTRRRFEESAWLRVYAALAERGLGVFSRDTGWLLAREAERRGRSAIVFEAVRAGSGSERALAPSPECEPDVAALAREYELFAYGGELWLCHKYGSGAGPWVTQHGNDAQFWRERCARVEAALARRDGEAQASVSA